MIQSCKFNPLKDLHEVDQFGFVDAVKASQEGVVPSNLETAASSFDGTEVDPESIVGRPRDVFDAMRMQDKLADGVRKLNQKSDSSDKE